ncbi:MAG: RNA chaperone Hfq [Paraclostridium sp.]
MFLMNGVQVKGNVRGFDSYIILLKVKTDNKHDI